MEIRRVITLVYFLINIFTVVCAFDFSPVRLKYKGGDWYNDPDCLKKLAYFVNSNTSVSMDTLQVIMEMQDERINEYPFLFMTGHGGLNAGKSEMDNLREYLYSGGFLYIDDDYGFNTDIRRFIGELFEDRVLIRLSLDSEIFSSYYNFSKMPKIHEHYKGESETYGLFINGKLAILYTYNTNISDGWADYDLYKDPESKRLDAQKMGVNFVYYALFK